MRVLIIGSGGREHALAWKIASSPDVEAVWVAPGNAGTALEPGVANVAIDVMDFEGLTEFARSESIDLVVVGPEAPLVEGIVDYMSARNIACFGPARDAARLEGSKDFTKAFMRRHGIPTADYETFTDLDAAVDYVRERGTRVVIKADGLAAGKGVIIPGSLEEAQRVLTDMLSGESFGEAGRRVVIEDFLEGEEASFIVISDGERIIPFASSQDHKAAYDGDQGPNTGGMGAYSPAPVVTEEVHRRIMSEIIEPAVRGMAEEDCPYTGFLYAGLMIAADGSPRVIEFNCRFGDPETQPILLRMRDDLAELCSRCVTGGLPERELDFDPRPALTVVMAAGGYPGSYARGEVITGIPEQESPTIKVFHAGTGLDDAGRILTSGGRVLGVTALGDSVTEAQRRAYEAVGGIRWKDAAYRTDIGYRAVARE